MSRMVAPYAATCDLCPHPIEPGQEIVADDETAPVHAECLDKLDVETADEGWWDQ